MTLNDYQKAAKRTSGNLTSWDKVRNGCAWGGNLTTLIATKTGCGGALTF